MATSPFDTLKAARTLEEAGFEKAQAEAVVVTVNSVVRHGIDAFARDLVTKDQFAETTTRLHDASVKHSSEFAELRAEFAQLRSEWHAGLAELRAEVALEFKSLYRHLWLMSASIVALTVTLTKLIP